MSGPLGGAVALPGRITAPSLPITPRRPRRVSRSRAGQPLPARVGAYLRSLPDHRLLDRLVRGRVWIPLLGVLLVGIVAIQVEVLKLGASIGRSMTLATQLQSRNQLLTASVARLSDDQRIMREAARLGMVMPGPTEQTFVPAYGPQSVSRAIRGIRAPNSQAFLSALAAQESSDGVNNPTLGSSGTPVPPNSPAAAAAPPGTAAAGVAVGSQTTTSVTPTSSTGTGSSAG